ncbi:MAG TPA: slipin family protein, partial [Candidatus Binatia bacterium]|nr:slipin family protein [Candidatus Binatia bacterium]
SAKLTEAAARMATEPISVQLRFLQTLNEIASEHTTTVVVPLPIDLISPLVDAARKKESRGSSS